MIMKKTMILAAVFGAVICASMTGCSVSISDETVSAAADAAVSVPDQTDNSINSQPADIPVNSDSDSDVQLQPAETATTPAATTAPASLTEPAAAAPTTAAAAVLQESEIRPIAEQLISEYCDIAESLQNGWVQTDASQSHKTDIVSDYYLVTDPELQSLADIPVYIAKTLTGDEYTRQVNAILNNDYDYPVYAEFDGKLYALDGACGSFYGSSEWKSFTFSNITADSFTVTGLLTQFEQFDYEQSFDVVRTPDGFRITHAGEAISK